MSDTPTAKMSAFARMYEKTILGYPLLIVFIFAAAVLFFGYHIKDFRMDASSDSLVLENDADLKYYETTRELFGSDDYILLAFTLDRSVVATDVLRTIERLSRELEQIESVESVTSIITVPLFHSPKVPLFEMGSNFKTLLMEDCDRQLALQELTSSPLYRNNLISEDGRTTAITVNFRSDPGFKALSDERYRLRRRRLEGTITPAETSRLKDVSRTYDIRHSELSAQRRAEVRRIRSLLEKYRAQGYDFVESGLPMIIADMVGYIERDIIVFGVGVLAFLCAVLGLLFRQLKWVVLPLFTCLITVVSMMGYLGLTGWETTVVTSNFSSLLLIISMALAIHLVVRVREIHARFPEREKQDVLFEAVRGISVPCFYTTTTTIVGFGTLIISGIRPVMDFGWLMAIGVGLAYLVNFTFLPAAILLFPKGPPPPRHLATLEKSPLAPLASFSEHHRALIGITGLALFAVAVYGMTKLKVESRFIDFFRSNTPISRGLVVIDNRLGGTTSLEVVLDGGQKDYWLEPESLKLLGRIHAYAEALPNVGKVVSLSTFVEILTGVNDGRPPNKFILNVARTSLSEKMKRAILLPYVTQDFSQSRLFIRIRESSPTLRRDEMLVRLTAFLRNDLQLGEDQARVTGIFILFNNLLKSLFDSQIKTLGMVFVAIYLMLVALFRSFYLGLLGIIPTALPVLLILGTMGLAGISLDMMTIMIASVTFGIAVDNVIHYTHRYRNEYQHDHDYIPSMRRSHNSIGLAILYSSMTIITGFGILALSNFIPTIYFGTFTGMAMAAALFGSLTLLPMMILVLRPFGPGRLKSGPPSAASPP